MNWIVALMLFFFGISLGSFANVLIDRLQNERKINGRSKCDFCGYRLSWMDNVPILSFLALRGKCRKCKKKLSWQYPLVELSTGLIFVITYWLFLNYIQHGSSLISLSSSGQLIYYILISYILWVILIWDLKYMIIPDFLIIIGLGLTLVYKVYLTFSTNCLFDWSCPLISGFLGSLVIGGFFAIVFYVSKGRGIGGGDVKIGFWLGLIVGIKMAYFFILFSYISGAVVAIFLLLFANKKMKSQIPFGPFLIISVYLIMFGEEKILEIWNNILV